MISLNYDDEVMIATDNVQDEASQLDLEMQKKVWNSRCQQNSK